MRTEDARATEPPCVVNPLRDEDSDPWRPPFRPSRPPFRPPRRNGRLQPGTGGRLPSESLVAFGLESVVAFARNTHFPLYRPCIAIRKAIPRYRHRPLGWTVF